MEKFCWYVGPLYDYFARWNILVNKLAWPLVTLFYTLNSIMGILYGTSSSRPRRARVLDAPLEDYLKLQEFKAKVCKLRPYCTAVFLPILCTTLYHDKRYYRCWLLCEAVVLQKGSLLVPGIFPYYYSCTKGIVNMALEYGLQNISQVRTRCSSMAFLFNV